MDRSQIAPLIHHLEQRARDHARPAGPPVWGPHLEQPAYYQIRSLSRPLAAGAAETQVPPLAELMGDLLTGLHSPGCTVRFLIVGEPAGVGVYLAVERIDGDGLLLPTLLQGVFPGLELSTQPLSKLGTKFYSSGLFNHMGMLCGIPTLKTTNQPFQGGHVDQIERVLRGLAGERWGYLVCASAIPQSTALTLAQQGLEQVSVVSEMVQEQSSFQGVQRVVMDGKLQTPTVSSSKTHYDAKFCLSLLEHNLERLQIGKAEGMWQCTVYFFAHAPSVRDRAGALLRAAFSGADSRPEAVRVFARPSDPQLANTDEQFQTWLNSREVATLCRLPSEEFAGYAVRDLVRFDTDPPPVAQSPFALGKVMDGARVTGHELALERDHLTKHGLIAGVTGSGKTTTVFSMLDRLYAGGRGIPFLVIEPAKTEYRNLLQAKGHFPNLRIYTLGDERFAPLRLNPFAFAIGDAERRIHVQTHIDFLKAVFNAAFVLYAPMPYVLEACLHEIYVDRGWDLATGQNQRLPLAQRGQESQWPVFPTLTDLYEKVDEVVDRLGYEERIQMDVKAGLKARLGSLRLGGKGFMLDCRHSVPIGELLKFPTVLEMAAIGNEDEKAFVLGLLLTALYEHYIVLNQMAPNAVGQLRHMTILEEAHRLLKNVSTDVETESANTRGQAVETFTNMLSEIRSFGEGVLIAEQIPSKLAPDAIKNTNLKIVHRLLAGDDREVLAATMNMNDEQSRFLTTLRAGQAVVHAEGADRPYLVGIENFKGQLALSGSTSDAQVRALMAAHLRGGEYDPFAGFSLFFTPQLLQEIAAKQKSLADVRNNALQVMQHEEFAENFDRFILGIVEAPSLMLHSFLWLRRLAQQSWVDEELLAPTLLYTLLSALAQHSARRGRQYRVPFHRLENTYHPLRRALAHVAVAYPYAETNIAKVQAQLTPLHGHIQADVEHFVQGYQKLTVAHAPFVACQHCKTRCRYRFDAERVAAKASSRQEFRQAMSMKDDQKMWEALKELGVGHAFQMVQVGKPNLPQDAILCVLIHAAQEMEMGALPQIRLVDNVKRLL